MSKSYRSDALAAIHETASDLHEAGVMDKRTVFQDGFVLARWVKVLSRGVLVGEPPNLWLFQDTNGDLRADRKELVTDRYGRREANVEHTENGLLWGLDNRIHMAGTGADMVLTFGSANTTLVLQGLTLPALIRALDVEDDSGDEREEKEALGIHDTEEIGERKHRRDIGRRHCPDRRRRVDHDPARRHVDLAQDLARRGDQELALPGVHHDEHVRRAGLPDSRHDA